MLTVALRPSVNDPECPSGAKSRDSQMSDEALQLLIKACEGLYQTERVDQSGQKRRGIDLAGNGRFVRNVIESAEEEREFRLANDDSLDLTAIDESVLMRIEIPDMQAALSSILATLGN